MEHRDVSAAEYRRYAAECLAAADRAQEPEVKRTLIDMAASWTKLADVIERAGDDDDDDRPSGVKLQQQQPQPAER
jgi:hypothetical protein